MTAVPLAVDIVAVCFFVACLHWHYGNWKKHQIVVTIVTFIAWYFPFMIIFVMPIDVSVTCYNQCVHDHQPTSATDVTLVSTSSSSSLSSTQSYDNATSTTSQSSDALLMSGQSSASPSSYCTEPLSFIPPPTLSIFWHIVYWTSQSLTWIILPMMQSYSKAGEFTFLGKFRYALIVNAIYYGTYLVIFGCCLIYLAARGLLSFSPSQLKVLAITASNTWGLFLLVLLLGYGLVEVPRLCWNNSKRGYMLSRSHFKIAKLSIEKIEAEEELEDVLAEVKKVADMTKPPNPQRKFVDIILKKCPQSVQQQSVASSQPSSRNRAAFDRTEDTYSFMTEKSLARLHRRLIVAIQRQSCTQCQWKKAVENAIDLEDVAENQASPIPSYQRSTGAYDGIFRHCYNARIEWYWKCWACPWLLRVAAVLMGLFSLMVVWSECLFFNRNPVLSLFALFMELTTMNYNYIAIEFVSVLTISYLSICTYYTIFKVRIFNYYYLVGPHETDENSMIFCGMLLCRLTPPLCLNFLGLIHLDSHITKDTHIVETAYTGFMGNMDVLSFISDGFNIYFPIAIVLLCTLTFFGIGTRVLHMLGFQQFIGDDDMTQEMIDEGVELVKRERRKRTRHEETEARRRNWNERFVDRTGNVQDPDENVVRRQATRNRASEHDRSELLNDAEPIDYRSSYDPEMQSTYRPQMPPPPQTATADLTGLYQSDPASRPQYFNTSQGFGSTTVRPNRPPPRNIFDDV